MYKEWDVERILKTKEVGNVAVIYSNDSTLINPLSANHTKRSNTLEQFANYRRIIWMFLTISWGGRLKG